MTLKAWDQMSQFLGHVYSEAEILVGHSAMLPKLYRLHARTGSHPACMECKQKDLDMSENVLSPLVSNKGCLMNCLLLCIGIFGLVHACFWKKHLYLCTAPDTERCASLKINLNCSLWRNYFWNRGNRKKVHFQKIKKTILYIICSELQQLCQWPILFSSSRLRSGRSHFVTRANLRSL